MRHDPASAAVVIMLRGLKMFGMAQAVGELMEQGAPAFDAAGAVFRCALAIGCALMLVSVALSSHMLAAPVGVEVAIANSAIGVNLP